jgi:hypothetical protein
VGALGVLNLAVGLPGIMLLAASPLLAFTLGNDAPTPRLTLFLALLILTAVLALSLPSEFHQAVYYVVGGLVLAALWWLFALRPRIANGTAGATMVRDAPGRDSPQ